MGVTRDVAAVALALAAAISLTRCGHDVDQAQGDAQAACTAYAEVSGRHQTAETVSEEQMLLRATVTHARAAASLDSRWSTLHADLESSLDLRRILPRATGAQSRRYFAADARVQGDCSEPVGASAT
ncbi:MAG TPA: hypothetical protein VGK78_00775 [Nocardioides sp.]|uniref:hypothetical protein n=1 Tax=Nocardioides sp. TaxID=35761 RepID=UPI002F3EF909